jgi:hypothetical protein
MDLHPLAVSLTQVSGWVLLFGVGIPGLIWLLGLVVALHGTAPRDRARIIDAYGRAFPGRRLWRSSGGH